MRRAARVDANQEEIVRALRRCGFQVEIIGKPLDLLVTNGKRTFLLECKDGSPHTKAQQEFISRWPGEMHTVTSPEEAVAAAVGQEAMR